MKRKILIILGSESDWLKIKHVFEGREWNLWIQVIVASCHRNPQHIRSISQFCVSYNLVICVGGMAFALPGVLDAWAHYYGSDTPIAGVALGLPERTGFIAAQLSISEIPGKPLLLDDDGQAYVGPEGLIKLLELSEGMTEWQRPSRESRPVNMDVWHNCPDDQLLRL